MKIVPGVVHSQPVGLCCGPVVVCVALAEQKAVSAHGRFAPPLSSATARAIPLPTDTQTKDKIRPERNLAAEGKKGN